MAIASLALTCVSEMSKIQQSELVKIIEEALAKMTKQMLGEQQGNGIIGNIYSTGLAMQVHTCGWGQNAFVAQLLCLRFLNAC